MLIKNPFKKPEDDIFLVYIILENKKDMKAFLTLVLIMSTVPVSGTRRTR